MISLGGFHPHRVPFRRNQFNDGDGVSDESSRKSRNSLTQPGISLFDGLNMFNLLNISDKFNGNNDDNSDEINETDDHTSLTVTDITPPPAVQKKTVSFDNSVKVILIPTTVEFRNAGIAEHIWWQTDDYNDMKLSAAKEIQDIIDGHNVDPREAMRLLYQPDAAVIIDTYQLCNNRNYSNNDINNYGNNADNLNGNNSNNSSNGLLTVATNVVIALRNGVTVAATHGIQSR